MSFMPDMPPQMRSRYADGTPAKAPTAFPPNLAADIPPDVQKEMLRWLSSKYIWPQIQERMSFEKMWNKILDMARINMPTDDLFANTRHKDEHVQTAANDSNRTKARVSDSVIHDAIQRLTDITCFIAFKEGLPAQFAKPDYIQQPYANKVYKPLEDRIQAANCILQWNSENQHVKRNSRILYRHHYTYGVAFVMSDYSFRVEAINRQDNQGNIAPRLEITDIGTTFEPISLRKLWLNWRLPAYAMDSQPCPFFFDETPRFAVMQNAYHPVCNPFGYVNLDKLGRGEMIYQGSEMTSIQDALKQTLQAMDNDGISNGGVSQLLDPKHSVEAKWMLFPMMPYDPNTKTFKDDGSIPYKRFVMEMHGNNIHSGSQVILRLQENYYPKNRLPIYASVHMPDLDSGLYAPSLGQLLYNHFKEITMCMEQFLDNKDLINNPPHWIQISSPAANVDVNQKNAKIMVNGPNDLGWRQVYDGTSSTVEMIRMLREDAQTTSKAVDAIMGKAMGSRTSATEASNAFQASMSAITTDIDYLSSDLHGGYADRVWDYTALWTDPDLLEHLTGQFGFAIKPEDTWASIGKKTNVGSTYVEKIVRSQNIRYILESSRNEPGLDRPLLWEELLDEMGFNGASIVDDGGRRAQIQFATVQTIKTYLGYPEMVDPDQDHQIAIEVKTSFLKDRNSIWNTEHADMTPKILQQIEQHQLIIQLQMQMQLAQEQAKVAQAQLNIHQENPPSLPSGSPGMRGGGNSPAQTAGDVAQQGAGAR
jgi:hypothetical protein